MKKLNWILMCVVFWMLACSSPKEIDESRLVYRNNLHYAINDENPFTGVAVKFYRNGQRESEEHFKNGKRHGMNTQWYQNGQKSSEGEYRNGEAHGKHISYYQNGQIKYEDNFKNGKKYGICIVWAEEGWKKSEADWKKDGTLVMTKYYKNGGKRSEEGWKDHYRHGLSIDWDENGQKESESIYENGQLKSHKDYRDKESKTEKEPADEKTENEITVVGSLKMIASIEYDYHKKTRVYTDSWEKLRNNENAYFFDQFESGVRSGYKYVISINQKKWYATAIPIEYGKTGVRSFFIDETTIIRGADIKGETGSLKLPML